MPRQPRGPELAQDERRELNERRLVLDEEVLQAEDALAALAVRSLPAEAQERAALAVRISRLHTERNAVLQRLDGAAMSLRDRLLDELRGWLKRWAPQERTEDPGQLEVALYNARIRGASDDAVRIHGARLAAVQAWASCYDDFDALYTRVGNFHRRVETDGELEREAARDLAAIERRHNLGAGLLDKLKATFTAA
jgi:hypothetical protein